MPRVRLACASLLLLAQIASAAEVHAQTPEPTVEAQPIHWAFASLVGTGWYEVGDGREAFVIGATPRQSIRKANLSESGDRRLGVRIRYDAALGLYSFDDLFEITDLDNFSTVSLVPGIELEIPVTHRWRLRAFANLGWGTTFDGAASAWIYYSGIKSQYLFERSWGAVALLNGYYAAGFSPDSGESGVLSALYAGIEVKQETNRLRWRTDAVDLFWSFGYRLMDDDVDFGVRDSTIESISDAAEVGLALSLRSRPFRVWGLEFERLGVTYARGVESDFESITLNFSSWFDQ